MRLSKLPASLCLGSILTLSMLAGRPLAAQGLRISDPPSIPDAGDGWQVEPVTRALTAVFPVQALPGAIPVPLSVRMNGTCALQYGPATTGVFPIYSTVHFGYVSELVTNHGLTTELQSRNDFVLEDGSLYKSRDFGSFNYDRKGRLLAQFGLAANPEFPFIHVSNDGRAKTYLAGPADLGRWRERAGQLNPAGFGFKPGGRPYLVLVTAQRARILAFLPEFQAYVPLLWLDAFGHAVSFQWTKHTSDLPTGCTGVLTVEIGNPESGKGLLVQWPQGGGDGLQEVLRADFVGVDAPSLQVRGWLGAGALPAGVAAPGGVSLIRRPPLLGGPVFRPQTLTLAPQGQLPAPAWLAAGQPLPEVVPGSPGQDPAPQVWSIGYDSLQSAVTAITAPNGLQTVFTSELWTSKLAFQTDWGAQSIAHFGIRTAVSTDPVNALTRTRNWVWDPRGVSEKAQVQQDYFGDAPIRETRTVFHATGHAGDNGAIQSWEVRDPESKAVARRTDIVRTTGGYKGFSTPRQTVTTRFPDPAGSPRPRAPETVETLTYDPAGLTVVQDALSAGGVPVRTRDFAYDPSPGFLVPPLLRRAVDTHFGFTGKAAPFLPTIAKDPAEPRRGPAASRPPHAEWVPARTVVLQYDATGSRITREELDAGALGKVGQSVTFDPDGRPTRVAPTHGVASTPAWSQALTYDPAGSGSVASATTTYATILGRPGSSSFAATVTGFDTLGRPTLATDARGVTTATTYDTRGRILSQAVEGLPVVTFRYSPDGATVTRTQGGVTTSTVTDLFGRTLAQTAADGTGVRMGYDAAGRLAWKRAVAADGSLQEPATWEYDLLDRVIRTVNPGGAGAETRLVHSASPDHPALARTVRILDPEHLKAVTTEDRDLFGQLVRRQDPAGVITTQDFDGLGNRTRVVTTEPGGGRTQTRECSFDGLARLLARSEPETGTTTYGNFDALGHPGTVTEANGRTRTQAFDGLGRPVAEANGVDALAWSYAGLDLASRSSTSALGTVTQAFQYEGPGARLSREATTQPGLSYAIRYAYDDQARLAAITYPSGRVIRYGYDALNRITRLQNNGAPLVEKVSYDAWGSRERITFASTAFSDWSRKEGGTHLDRWTLGYRPGGALADGTGNPRLYRYDPAERLTQAAEWSLTPDPDGRLVGASAPDLSLVEGTFRHDGFGNNTASSYGGAASVPLTRFAIDPGRDNLTPALDTKGALTGWTYGNPGNGEAQTVGLALGDHAAQLGLAWDGLGRLAQVSHGLTGGIDRYQYAPSGLRAARRDSLDPSRNASYAYAASNRLLTGFDAGGAARDVVYLGGRAIAEIDAQGVHELHPDHLGTPRIITLGATGQIEGRQSFGAYGESLPAATAGYLPMTGYAGHLQTEPNGLIYMKGRFYSPVWHRFVNSDQGADPNSLNQFAFCGGNPMMFVDPTGLSFFGSLWDGILSFFGGGSGKGSGQGGTAGLPPIEGIGGGSGGSKTNQKAQPDPQILSAWLPGAKWASESTIDAKSSDGQSYHYEQQGFWYMSDSQMDRDGPSRLIQRQYAINQAWNEFKVAKGQLRVNWNPGWDVNGWLGVGATAGGTYYGVAEAAAWGRIPVGVAVEGGGLAVGGTVFSGLGAGFLAGAYVSNVWENYESEIFSLEIKRDSAIFDAMLTYQHFVK